MQEFHFFERLISCSDYAGDCILFCFIYSRLYQICTITFIHSENSFKTWSLYFERLKYDLEHLTIFGEPIHVSSIGCIDVLKIRQNW